MKTNRGVRRRVSAAIRKCGRRGGGGPRHGSRQSSARGETRIAFFVIVVIVVIVVVVVLVVVVVVVVVIVVVVIVVIVDVCPPPVLVTTGLIFLFLKIRPPGVDCSPSFDRLAKDLGAIVVAIDCFLGRDKRDDHPDDFINWIRRRPFDDDDEDDNDGRSTTGTRAIRPVREDVESCLGYLASQHGVDPSNVWGVWAMTKALSSGAASESTRASRSRIGRSGMARRASERAPLLFCVAGNDADNPKPPY